MSKTYKVSDLHIDMGGFMKRVFDILFSENMWLLIISILTALQGLYPDILNDFNALLVYIGYLTVGVLFQNISKKAEKAETDRKIDRLEKQIKELKEKIN